VPHEDTQVERTHLFCQRAPVDEQQQKAAERDGERERGEVQHAANLRVVVLPV
jgi:hypothetical protein